MAKAMVEPRVSVICIFFNEAKFLAEAIDSVLAQTFDDYELLLADDGSTDGSTQIALEYARGHPERVRYLEHAGHANRGAAATRNLGVSSARGGYLALLDADDHWRPAKLADQVALLDAHADVGMVCGSVNYWSSWEGGEDRVVPTGPVREGTSRPPETSLTIYPLGSTHAPCPSDVMVRRALVERVRGFEESFVGALQLYEDQVFFAKIYLAAPVYFSSRVWLDYRLHNESCVARVLRDGGYDAVRSRFLDWFADYLRPRVFPGKKAVVGALRKARFRLHHPRLSRLPSRLRRLAAATSSR